MKICGVKMHDTFTGLCNQLISLIVRIQRAKKYGFDVLMIDDFMMGIEDGGTCPIDHILCLDSLNEAASPVILSGKNLDLRIDKVEYGCEDARKDITAHFIKNEDKLKPLRRFSIDKTINLNAMEGDPCPGIKKDIIITYCINNNYRLVKKYVEDCSCIETPIDINLDNMHYSFQFGWMNSDNPISDFESILGKIRFHPSFYRKRPVLMSGSESADSTCRTHVIHLRIEPDAISHWSAKNNISKEDFEKTLCSRYIDTLKTHVLNKNCRRPSDRILVLSYSESNPVLDFLKNEEYPYFSFYKDRYRGREWNAITDLVGASNLCNGIFIGNFDLDRVDGSTFSYILYTRLKKKKEVLSILINLDHVYQAPCVISS